MGAFTYLCTALGMAPLLALFRRDGAAVLFESTSGSPYGSWMGYFLFLGLACVGACAWLYLCSRNAAVRSHQSDRRLVLGISTGATAVLEDLYRKLGVHKKQEVMELVARAMEMEQS